MAGVLRKRNRLDPSCYVGPNTYFVTICVEQRKPILAQTARVEVLLKILREVCAAHQFQIYAYCLMPDHLHLEVIGTSQQSSLPRFLRSFKGKTTAAMRKLGIHNLWQKGYYEHINRPGELEAIADYVFSNPTRAGLVKSMYDWPYLGSFLFDWKKFAPPKEPFRPPWKMPPKS